MVLSRDFFKLPVYGVHFGRGCADQRRVARSVGWPAPWVHVPSGLAWTSPAWAAPAAAAEATGAGRLQAVRDLHEVAVVLWQAAVSGCLSTRMLAAIAGVSQTSVVTLWAGSVWPSAVTVARVAHVLGYRLTLQPFAGPARLGGGDDSTDVDGAVREQLRVIAFELFMRRLACRLTFAAVARLAGVNETSVAALMSAGASALYDVWEANPSFALLASVAFALDAHLVVCSRG
jgi:transcriptional regulator with XRE-family HTH domain